MARTSMRSRLHSRQLEARLYFAHDWIRFNDFDLVVLPTLHTPRTIDVSISAKKAISRAIRVEIQGS